MLDTQEYRDRNEQAQYPDALRLRLPRGFRERVQRAAKAEGVFASELIRRAVASYLEDNDTYGNGGLSAPIARA